MSKLYDARRKYHEKKAENESVLKEFGFLDAGSAVYKLVGPVLAKQDVKEAKQTVEKRLAYINKEMLVLQKQKQNRKRIEKTMEEFEKQAKAKKDKIMAIQQKLQQEALKHRRPGPPIQKTLTDYHNLCSDTL
eukprot:TRINITY_DN133_c0_g1_i1.p11 TRINITY_DN133_c0_g1~~TRINITY_DN133_c0_g1_i1.p11  ORF type:complete len:133 (+),score=23.75 TRINITY_DN133_c0_g1_i1:675-1073(+)